jgi:hypothetical protein
VLLVFDSLLEALVLSVVLVKDEVEQQRFRVSKE